MKILQVIKLFMRYMKVRKYVWFGTKQGSRHPTIFETWHIAYDTVMKGIED